ncbi:hypothetical protein CPC08DRAFT_796278 [Agrocybe pediades]|nr:hypothetical protein CPC08DRAFT_796278 [Agrocybe pediades]
MSLIPAWTVKVEPIEPEPMHFTQHPGSRSTYPSSSSPTSSRPRTSRPSQVPVHPSTPPHAGGTRSTGGPGNDHETRSPQRLPPPGGPDRTNWKAIVGIITPESTSSRTNTVGPPSASSPTSIATRRKRKVSSLCELRYDQGVSAPQEGYPVQCKLVYTSAGDGPEGTVCGRYFRDTDHLSRHAQLTENKGHGMLVGKMGGSDTFPCLWVGCEKRHKQGNMWQHITNTHVNARYACLLCGHKLMHKTSAITDHVKKHQVFDDYARYFEEVYVS